MGSPGFGLSPWDPPWKMSMTALIFSQIHNTEAQKVMFEVLGPWKSKVFKVRSQHHWFFQGFLRIRVKNRSPIPAKSVKIIVKINVCEPHEILNRIHSLKRKRNIRCETDPGFPTPGVRMTVVYTNSLKLYIYIYIYISAGPLVGHHGCWRPGTNQAAL